MEFNLDGTASILATQTRYMDLTVREAIFAIIDFF
jgi:hypothetical protein